ncbi:MAG: response regulator transcription factor [Flavobacteriales bacterium]|nr:response regulator transcription factor [Flavobacteriales bacterium]
MKKVLVIDDEKPTRDFIKRLIDSYHFGVEVFTDGENVATGVEAIHRIQPDLVILDIQMPDGNGFDVLKSIPVKNFEVIFITAFQEFAIQAIKFSALDYILKPIDSEELKQAIDSALNTITKKTDESQLSVLQHNMQLNAKRRLVLKTQESVHVVEIDDIIRCESDKNYTLFFFKNGKKILVSKTLKDFDVLLSGLTFFRAQQSHLINLNYIERYDRHDGTIMMKDGSAIPLALARKEQFFEILDAM